MKCSRKNKRRTSEPSERLTSSRAIIFLFEFLCKVYFYIIAKAPFDSAVSINKMLRFHVPSRSNQSWPLKYPCSRVRSSHRSPPLTLLSFHGTLVLWKLFLDFRLRSLFFSFRSAVFVCGGCRFAGRKALSARFANDFYLPNSRITRKTFQFTPQAHWIIASGMK